jgi:hypothetical protein
MTRKRRLIFTLVDLCLLPLIIYITVKIRMGKPMFMYFELAYIWEGFFIWAILTGLAELTISKSGSGDSK